MLGLEFTIQSAAITEQVAVHESPEEFAKRMAHEKVQHIASKNSNGCIIGADTVVTQNQTIFGKPRDKHEALYFLQSLNGTEHTVYTGVAVYHATKMIEEIFSVQTQVQFGTFSEETLMAYIESGDPMDKAGGYGIQSEGGFLVQAINGSYTNVVGLPLAELTSSLLKHGIIST